MKLHRNNKTYIQKNDILCLINSGLPIPADIYQKIINLRISGGKEFIEIRDKEEIEYLSTISWIMDYDQIDILTEEEIFEKSDELKKQMSELLERCKNMDINERLKYLNEYRNLALTIQALREIYWIKKGYEQIELPAEVRIRKK